MWTFTIGPSRNELQQARVAVRDALGRRVVDESHVSDVVLVVNELLAAARDCEVRGPVEVNVSAFPMITSVRLRCDRDVELRDRPFDMRERLIHRLAIAFGRRRRPDGFVDLWAEIPRRR